MPEFQDIVIIDLDENRTYNPDPSRLLYNIFLKLSASPPPAWQEIFDGERRFPRHSMWRRAWVAGSYIVVHAPLEEIEEHHLPDLREDVQNTNLKYRAYLAHKAKVEDQEHARKGREQGEIKNLRRRLGFGSGDDSTNNQN